MDLGRYLEINHIKIEDFSKDVDISVVMLRKVISKERRLSDDNKLAILKATRGQVTLDDLVVDSKDLRRTANGT